MMVARKRTDSEGNRIAVDECQGFDLKPDDGSSPRCERGGIIAYYQKTGSSVVAGATDRAG